MKFGMNLLLWTGELNDGLIPVLHMLKKQGYDGVELPIFNTSLDYAKWGKTLDEIGLARTAVTVRTVEDNPISPDAAVRKKGIEGNNRVLDCCAAAGATHLVGPYHSALGHFSGKGRTADEWKWGVEIIGPADEAFAGGAAVVFADVDVAEHVGAVLERLRDGFFFDVRVESVVHHAAARMVHLAAKLGGVGVCVEEVRFKAV